MGPSLATDIGWFGWTSTDSLPKQRRVPCFDPQGPLERSLWLPKANLVFKAKGVWQKGRNQLGDSRQDLFIWAC